MKTLSTIVLAAAVLSGCGFARTPAAYRDESGAALGPKNEAIRACYDGIIKTNPNAGGKVTVTFVVDTEMGNIGDVRVDAANTTAPDPIAECVIANISSGLALSPVDANKGEGTWVYEFTPPAPAVQAAPAAARGASRI